MKKVIKTFKWILVTILILSVGLYVLGYGYIFKGIQVVYFTGHTTAFIDDYSYFDNRTIETSTQQPWKVSDQYNSASPTKKLQDTNSELGTVAFFIIKDGKIWYENYAENYSKTSKTNSFSMAKSFTVSLLFKAIQDGYIKNLEQPITDFFPDYKGEFASQCTVGDLASMASGLNWDEQYYSPFSMTAKSYYDNNIRSLMKSLEIEDQPGQSFKYLSGNTQLLGMVIEKATNKSLSEYLSQSIWRPLGMNDFGLWQLDGVKSGMEKSYCCIATNARNFAKLGQLYLQNGQWNGKQILQEKFVKMATYPRFEDSPQYGYGFWLSDYKDKHIFTMRGILGQYVIGIPEDDLLIVRLGHKRSPKKINHFPKDFYVYIDEAYKMLSKKD
ncbi:serine hydrolase domain-containing protein [Flavobacteriaceae bacterium 14752]|uniref:serine hydrolase domain-containing protein n=1 Tax=Mesohalobacter salilacus TaxID=2491711 RepID=UPI000F6322FA|nr:class C beta-lactamase-related serine hydrolase [Flavobacteriaceae bacterium 14752]